MGRSRRYQFDAGNGAAASFRFTGKGQPSAKLCLAMQTLANIALAHFTIENRACDPRPGDRWIGLDGVTTSEITAVDEMGGGITDPEINQIVSYTHSQTGPRVHQVLIGEYRQLVAAAIKGGHIFHAVEDDEE